MRTLILSLLIITLNSCSDKLEETVNVLNTEFAERNYVAVIQHFKNLDNEALLQLSLEMKKKVAKSAFYTANTEDAIALYQKFIELDDKDGESYFYLALLHQNDRTTSDKYLLLASKAGFKPDHEEMIHLFDRNLLWNH